MRRRQIRSRKFTTQVRSIQQHRVASEPLEGRVLLAASINTLGTFSTSGPFNPGGTVVRDSGGNIYGIANDVGGQSQGSGIFRLAKGSGTPTLVASFPSNGGFSADPVGLVIDSNDNIFGVTENGGDATLDGTVFEIAKGSSTITTLASFDQSTTGHSPNGNIEMDSSGSIYGVCDSGGTLGGGNVWKFTINGAFLQQVAPFSPVGGLEGVFGADGIAIDGSGNLFGTTSGYSLAGDDGTIWEVPAGTSAIQTLARLQGTDGIDPSGSIVVDGSGNIFGECQYGGAGNVGNTPPGQGTVYELVKGSSTVTVIGSFNGANGQHPVGGLIADKTGNLFGVTREGGTTSAQSPSGAGTVFEVAGGSNIITTLGAFNESNGKDPLGGLTQDSAGILYGTASAGSGQNGGTVFAIGASGQVIGGVGSLTAGIAVKSPANAVAGIRQTITITSTLTNTGSTKVTQTLTGSVYLSATGLIDSNSILLGKSKASKFVLAAHKHIAGHATLRGIPAGVGAGTFNYIFRFTDPSTGQSVDAVSSNTVTVAPPQIDLAGSFAKFVSTGKRGKPLVETISVSNIGANVAAAGAMKIVVGYIPTDGSAPVGALPATFNQRINIKPGKSARLTLHLKAPVAGSYAVLVTLDSSAIKNATDINLANNIFNGTTSLVIS